MGRRDRFTHSQRALAASLAALLLLGPGASALAAPARQSVLVLPYPALPGASDAFAAKVFGQILGELKGRSELKLADLPKHAAGSSASNGAKDDAIKTRAQAAQLFAKAGEQSQRNKPRPAAQTLQKAALGLMSQPLALDEAGGRLLGDVLLQQAVDQAMAGDEFDATLAEVVRRAPEKTLAVGAFPPAFARSFDSMRLRVLSQNRSVVRVLAPQGVTGARVLLDGRPLGAAPLQLTDVLPGDHALRVEAGDDAWAEIIHAEPGAELQRLPKLGEGSDASSELGSLPQGQLDKATVSRLARLGKAAGAQAVLAGVVSREGDGYAVRSALVLVKGEKALQLASLALDAEMLSASLEVLRLADDVVAKLTAPGTPASLPLVMGTAAAPEATAMASAAAAPPAPETALALPAASDLAAAAGVHDKADLPLPIEEPAPSATPAPAPAQPEPAPAPIASAPAPVAAAPAPPPSAPIAEEPAPATTSRRPIMPGQTPAAAPQPAPAQPALAGSLDAALADLNSAPPPAKPAPAKPAPVVVAPAPAKPAPAPAQPAPAPIVVPAPAEPDASLATSSKKPVQPDEPSKDLFVPRQRTTVDDDEPVAKPAVTPAPIAATRVEAGEAREAVVHEPGERKSHTALWIVAGALVVGAAAVAGIVVYENNQTATTSNVSVSWSGH